MKKYIGMAVEEVLKMVPSAYVDEEEGDVIIPNGMDGDCALYVEDDKIVGFCFCDW
jgi:hypothetical protein